MNKLNTIGLVFAALIASAGCAPGIAPSLTPADLATLTSEEVRAIPKDARISTLPDAVIYTNHDVNYDPGYQEWDEGSNQTYTTIFKGMRQYQVGSRVVVSEMEVDLCKPDTRMCSHRFLKVTTVLRDQPIKASLEGMRSSAGVKIGWGDKDGEELVMLEATFAQVAYLLQTVQEIRQGNFGTSCREQGGESRIYYDQVRTILPQVADAINSDGNYLVYHEVRRAAIILSRYRWAKQGCYDSLPADRDQILAEGGKIYATLAAVPIPSSPSWKLD